MRFIRSLWRIGGPKGLPWLEPVLQDHRLGKLIMGADLQLAEEHETISTWGSASVSLRTTETRKGSRVGFMKEQELHP